MKYALIIACFCATAQGQELPDANSGAQAQLKKTFDAFRRLEVISYDNVEIFREAQKVKQIVADEAEVVRQLAIFVATTESSENSHVLFALMLWRYLNVSPDATIRVLSPYLDASNAPLREFAREWFGGHDDFDRYRDYVMWKVSREEEIPAPFIEYIYARSPGRAMRALQRGSVDVRAQLEVVRKQIEAARQGRKPTTPDEMEEAAARKGRDILLAEHIISNALWLHKNGFHLRFQVALPEAMAEFEKLAKHDQWWARLYVVHIMRQNPVLFQDHLMRQLAEDENPLVSEAAKGLAARRPDLSDDGREKPLAAPREVDSRAIGPTSIEVTWQPSDGATSYVVQRRQPDTETEFTTIAPNVTGTSFIDAGLAKDTLYEYRVIARQNP